MARYFAFNCICVPFTLETVLPYLQTQMSVPSPIAIDKLMVCNGEEQNFLVVR